jgi:predicted DNA-binding antitoxin AbrB/MazE fold protein
MSIAARHENGVLRPLGEVKEAREGRVYRIFSQEELRGLKDQMSWLKAAEPGFEFWDNEDDAVYDRL